MIKFSSNVREGRLMPTFSYEVAPSEESTGEECPAIAELW
jgi:hypothetical protein